MFKMINKYIFPFVLILQAYAFAGVYGTDDRLDFYDIKDERIKELSKSSAALIPKIMLTKQADGNFKINAKTLKQEYNFCDDALFSDQSRVANCSAALVRDDLILTAAHCVDGRGNEIEDYYVVFDYKLTSENAVLNSFAAKDVYEFEKKIYFNYDATMSKSAIDIAIIKLKRKSDRKPIELDYYSQYLRGTPVFALGYPLGIYQKLAPNGNIWESERKNSFRLNLDLFSVNSGSPIFDANTYKIIGVHARGTSLNFDRNSRSCTDWFQADINNDYGEPNKLDFLKPVFESLGL